MSCKLCDPYAEATDADLTAGRTLPLGAVTEVGLTWSSCGWCLCVALVLFELHHMAFYALFVAVGAFAAGVVALVAPESYGLQALVAAGVSVGGVVLVRPYVSTAFHRHRGGHVAIGVHGGLVGQQAITLDEVGDAHQVGHVKLAGERWLAVTGGPTIDAGTLGGGHRGAGHDTRGVARRHEEHRGA